MIPATHPYTAVYRHTEPKPGGGTRERWDHRPVIAWGDDGRALVADDRGSLIPASALSGFQHLSEGADDRVVGVIPGGDWRVVWQLGTPDQFVEPVLCWLAYANGDVKAVAVDEHKYAEPIELDTAEAHLYPPDAELPAAGEVEQRDQGDTA